MEQLSWIVWDPPREAFTIPYINHPVMWYGLWFALGFILAYLLIIRIFTQLIQSLPYITEKQVIDWKLLISQLKDGFEIKDPSFSSIIDKLNPKLRRELFSLKQQDLPHEDLKKGIINSINLSLSNQKKLYQLFPLSIETASSLARSLADRLSWYSILGTVIGSRLGHVLFYDLQHYLQDPLSVFRIWEGGLASHGGTVGLLVAVFFYHKYLMRYIPSLNFLSFLDIFAVVVPLGCVCIRIGNFFNQEILGPPTTLPWAILFAHPFDHEEVVPRHPTQLYEAFAYLATFVLLYTLWRWKKTKLPSGYITGILFICIFTSRFFIEFVKLPQGGSFEGILQTGQYLSIPFIVLGFAFLLFAKWNKKRVFNP